MKEKKERKATKAIVINKKSNTSTIPTKSTINDSIKEIKTIEQLINRLKTLKKIIVITGAGISVSCGIPDFRSKDVGIYNNLDCSSINIPSAELLFDLEYFCLDPAPFYKYAEMLLPNENILPSKCHHFIKHLEKRKMLLRNYTQNVDGLEKKAGITKVIQCHGSLSTFKCLDCKQKRNYDDEIEQCIRNKEVPICQNNRCKGDGILKPEITFNGERVPKLFEKTSQIDLTSKCDCIIVIGTSLQVGGSVHEILKKMDVSIPRILINKNIVNIPDCKGFDLSLLGDCDAIVSYLCSLLEWRIDTSASNLIKWECTLAERGIYEIKALPI